MRYSEQVFNGSRVFLALRTSIFKDFDKGEHITLEFLGSFPKYSLLVDKLKDWQYTFNGFKPREHFAVRVEVNGYANYIAGSPNDERYFQTAMIRFPEYGPELNYSKFWHLTMGKQDQPFEEARVFDKEVDAFNYDICDDIWIGYKDQNNELRWVSGHGRFPMKNSPLDQIPF
jgi:hypothetical protein